MEYMDKIKEACANHTLPDIVWVEQLQEYLEDIEIRRALNAEAVLKYQKTEKGKQKHREAQARYYQRKKMEKTMTAPTPPPTPISS